MPRDLALSACVAATCVESTPHRARMLTLHVHQLQIRTDCNPVQRQPRVGGNIARSHFFWSGNTLEVFLPIACIFVLYLRCIFGVYLHTSNRSDFLDNASKTMSITRPNYEYKTTSKRSWAPSGAREKVSRAAYTPPKAPR